MRSVVGCDDAGDIGRDDSEVAGGEDIVDFHRRLIGREAEFRRIEGCRKVGHTLAQRCEDGIIGLYVEVAHKNTLLLFDMRKGSIYGVFLLVGVEPEVGDEDEESVFEACLQDTSSGEIRNSEFGIRNYGEFATQTFI